MDDVGLFAVFDVDRLKWLCVVALSYSYITHILLLVQTIVTKMESELVKYRLGIPSISL